MRAPARWFRYRISLPLTRLLLWFPILLEFFRFFWYCRCSVKDCFWGLLTVWPVGGLGREIGGQSRSCYGGESGNCRVMRSCRWTTKDARRWSPLTCGEFSLSSVSLFHPSSPLLDSVSEFVLVLPVWSFSEFLLQVLGELWYVEGLKLCWLKKRVRWRWVEVQGGFSWGWGWGKRLKGWWKLRLWSFEGSWRGIVGVLLWRFKGRFGVVSRVCYGCHQSVRRMGRLKVAVRSRLL